MSAITDLWNGIKDAARQQWDEQVARSTTNNPVAAGGAASAGRTIVDVASETLALIWRGETDEARRKAAEAFANSGTGSKFINEVRQQEIAKFLKNPVVWIVAIVAVIGLYGLVRGR